MQRARRAGPAGTDRDLKWRVTTGPDGRFAIDQITTGEVTVTVRAGGFAEKIERVTDASAVGDDYCAKGSSSSSPA